MLTLMCNLPRYYRVRRAIMCNLPRYYRDSGLVIYESKLPAPSPSMPCTSHILTHLKAKKKQRAAARCFQVLIRVSTSQYQTCIISRSEIQIVFIRHFILQKHDIINREIKDISLSPDLPVV